MAGRRTPPQATSEDLAKTSDSLAPSLRQEQTGGARESAAFIPPSPQTSTQRVAGPYILYELV